VGSLHVSGGEGDEATGLHRDGLRLKNGRLGDIPGWAAMPASHDPMIASKAFAQTTSENWCHLSGCGRWRGKGRLHQNLEEGPEPGPTEEGPPGIRLREGLRRADELPQGGPACTQGGHELLSGGRRTGGLEAISLRVLLARAHRFGERAARARRRVREPPGEHRHDHARREAGLPRLRGGCRVREGPDP
jgi:hypothetical protein